MQQSFTRSNKFNLIITFDFLELCLGYILSNSLLLIGLRITCKSFTDFYLKGINFQ